MLDVILTLIDSHGKVMDRERFTTDPEMLMARLLDLSKPYDNAAVVARFTVDVAVPWGAK